MHALTASVDSVLLSLHLAIHKYAVCEHNDGNTRGGIRLGPLQAGGKGEAFVTYAYLQLLRENRSRSIGVEEESFFLANPVLVETVADASVEKKQPSNVFFLIWRHPP